MRRSEGVAVSVTAAANLAVNRLPPKAYVPANVGAAVLLTWLARRLGATWPDMGLDPRRLGSGIRWGLAAAVPVAGAVALGVTIPATRRLFADDRAATAGRREVLYQTLVRIPLGTALPEETLFRGALLGIFERRRSRRVADVLSGVLFGLWHVLPATDRHRGGWASEVVRQGARGRATVVGGDVLATMAAGYGLAWLRDRSGSLAAPIVAHAALNSFGYLGARVASRNG
jgi:membrane protease YdiL (CAAX protease family)